MLAKKKILIIRFSSIGDIVLTTPVIRCLKTQIPNAEIHFLSKKMYGDLLKVNPHLSRIHLLDNNLSEIISTLKKEKFDFIVDLHHNLRSKRVKWSLGIPSASFHKLNWEKWLLVNFRINKLPNKHVVDRYLDTCKDLGVINDGLGLDCFIPKEEEIELQTLPANFRNGYIAFAIGAQHATKRLPLEKLISVSKKIAWPIIFLGGKEDFITAEKIVNTLGITGFNACGKYTINQSASFVKKSVGVITHDTGLMHIATAFNKPIVSVWGNTIPEFGMYPYKTEQSLMVQVEDLECRPCSKIGFNECPQGHFKCMKNINEDLIANTVNNL